jgi:hypothetical protein
VKTPETWIRNRRTIVAVWATGSILWILLRVAPSLANQEAVPVTGRIWCAGQPWADANRDQRRRRAREQYVKREKEREEEPECSSKSPTPDDPRVERVKAILDRLSVSAGLDAMPWRLILGDLES